MQTSRASTRRAALAAFLLFAAGLFVVGPADASRTTDPRSSLTPISAPILASSSSLELSLLEPLASVDTSPRLGFAEDLGLLDPEAGPGGFVVFAAEAAQCELTYARNNPVTFIDPFGLMAECVGTQCTDSATVIAADPGAEAARRFELELRMMRLRSSRDQATSRQRQILGDVYRMSNRPVNYIAAATGVVMIPVAGLTLAPEAALTSIGYDAAAVAPGLIDVGGFGFTELYYAKLLGVGGRAFPALVAKMLMEGRGTSIGLLSHPEQTFRLWEYQVNGQYYSLVMNPISRWVVHVGQSGGPWR